MLGLQRYDKRAKIIYLSPLLFRDIYASSNCFGITLSLSGEHKETALPFSRLTIHSVSLTEYISNCVLYIFFATVFFCNHSVFMIFSYCFIFKPQYLTATYYAVFRVFWYFSGATFKWKFPKLIVSEVIRRSCCGARKYFLLYFKLF